MTKLRLVCDTGFVGAVHEDYLEVPDEEWNAMTPAEQRDYGYEAAQELVSNYIETYYEVVEDGDE